MVPYYGKKGRVWKRSLSWEMRRQKREKLRMSRGSVQKIVTRSKKNLGRGWVSNGIKTSTGCFEEHGEFKRAMGVQHKKMAKGHRRKNGHSLSRGEGTRNLPQLPSLYAKRGA